VPDARVVLDELAADGDVLALVLADHRLPGTSGVDFLVQLHEEAATAAARKVLVTGQADLDDTVRAVNRASLDRYVAKPWTAEELLAVTRDELTSFVLATGLDPLPHLRALDAAALRLHPPPAVAEGSDVDAGVAELAVRSRTRSLASDRHRRSGPRAGRRSRRRARSAPRTARRGRCSRP
jgi:DNA-binding response OmpR family regulator